MWNNIPIQKVNLASTITPNQTIITTESSLPRQLKTASNTSKPYIYLKCMRLHAWKPDYRAESTLPPPPPLKDKQDERHPLLDKLYRI